MAHFKLEKSGGLDVLLEKTLMKAERPETLLNLPPTIFGHAAYSNNSGNYKQTI